MSVDWCTGSRWLADEFGVPVVGELVFGISLGARVDATEYLHAINSRTTSTQLTGSSPIPLVPQPSTHLLERDGVWIWPRQQGRGLHID